MYLLNLVYSALAFAEVLVLFASAMALLALAARQVVRVIDSLIGVVIDAGSHRLKPRVQGSNTLSLVFESRPCRIPGGHNERF